MKTLFVIPAHNEAESLPSVIRELLSSIPAAQVLVVDDGSIDGTEGLLPLLPVRRLHLPKRLGVGNAVRAGLRYAHRNGFSHVVRVDADGQHAPHWVPQLLAALEDSCWDAVTGSRFLDPKGIGKSGLKRWAQRGLGLCLSVLTGRRVTDPTSGFWAFGPRAVSLLAEHYPTGYSEPELRLLLSRSGMRAGEIAVQMRPRLGGHTTLTLERATLACLRAMLAMLLVPLRSVPAVGPGAQP